ncbi:MAG: sugar ABC transporter permease [Chloroflexi bacterium]|nr:sugar ABC transporter permease [Chloroflexota bacterium]
MLTRQQRLLLLAPLALVLVPFLIWPALFGFLASFTNYAPAQAHLQLVSLANYKTVIGDQQFRAAFRNILVFGVVAISAELAIGFGIAYLLREPFRGRELLRVVLLLPWLVSPLASGVMWHFLFSSSTGMHNFLLASLRLPTLPSPLGTSGLALPATIATDIWRKSPLVSFLLLPGLLALPPELWEQATLEGASLVSRIRHIALPGLTPLILTVALLLVGDTLGLFDSIVIMTGGGPGSETITPALYSYQQAFQINNWPVGATSAWFIVAAVLLVGLCYLSLARQEAS